MNYQPFITPKNYDININIKDNLFVVHEIQKNFKDFRQLIEFFERQQPNVAKFILSFKDFIQIQQTTKIQNNSNIIIDFYVMCGSQNCQQYRAVFNKQCNLNELRQKQEANQTEKTLQKLFDQFAVYDDQQAFQKQLLWSTFKNKQQSVQQLGFVSLDMILEKIPQRRHYKVKEVCNQYNLLYNDEVSQIKNIFMCLYASVDKINEPRHSESDLSYFLEECYEKSQDITKFLTLEEIYLDYQQYFVTVPENLLNLLKIKLANRCTIQCVNDHNYVDLVRKPQQSLIISLSNYVVANILVPTNVPVEQDFNDNYIFFDIKLPLQDVMWQLEHNLNVTDFDNVILRQDLIPVRFHSLLITKNIQVLKSFRFRSKQKTFQFKNALVNVYSKNTPAPILEYLNQRVMLETALKKKTLFENHFRQFFANQYFVFKSNSEQMIMNAVFTRIIHDQISLNQVLNEFKKEEVTQSLGLSDFNADIFFKQIIFEFLERAKIKLQGANILEFVVKNDNQRLQDLKPYQNQTITIQSELQRVFDTYWLVQKEISNSYLNKILKKYNEVIGEISAQKIARQLGVVTIQQIMEDINLKVDQKIILDFKNVELSEKWIMINGKQYELYGYIKGLYRKDRLDADAMKDLGQ
ncbi:Hypothetical_protein [Hexamita inflata]|uniref:Hypothetical_protein n=1 Tax=Hexamita inflata TaxID=28002 RepID=A0AA86PKY1_9EUKA|nr:Hypothetical protein HINF_LOCUS27777 [Hexamita inflata]